MTNPVASLPVVPLTPPYTDPESYLVGVLTTNTLVFATGRHAAFAPAGTEVLVQTDLVNAAPSGLDFVRVLLVRDVSYSVSVRYCQIEPA